MHIYYNPNPSGARVGDCAVRALCKALDAEWMDIYTSLCSYGVMHCDLPSSNAVWGHFLRDNGYKRQLIPERCPACYTVRDFASEHSKGVYILATNGHVLTVVDGDYYDSWDSGDEVPVYYWMKGE